MRNITIRQFSINLFKELEDLPFMVTRYGKPYVIVSKSMPVKEVTTVMPREIPKVPTPKEYKPTPVLATPSIKPCSHGILFGCGKCKT